MQNPLKFSKSEIEEIKKSLYEIENKKDLPASRENLLELEKILSRLKKYYDKDEYREIRSLLDLPIDEDYYKPIITDSAFNSNCIQYESMGDEGKDKNLSVEEYLDKIKPYLRDIINDHKTQVTRRIHSGNTIAEHKGQSEWKIQLTVEINFVPSLPNSDETRIMRPRSDNIEIMMGSETEEVIKKLVESLSKRYQKRLEESMDGSHFTYDGVNALYYVLNTVSLSRGRSYIDSPEWLKNK